MNRPAAMVGFGGVALNVAAAAFLGPVPHAYKPETVSVWLAEVQAAPFNAIASSVSFTVGLVCLVAMMAGLACSAASRKSVWVVGATPFGAGALLDAAGTMAPVAALQTSHDAGIALLWLTLVLDSMFNLLLGLGLVVMAFAQVAEDGWPRWLRWLALVAGVLSLPVGLQFTSDALAKWLFVASPFWLGWLVITSVVLFRRSFSPVGPGREARSRPGAL